MNKTTRSATDRAVVRCDGITRLTRLTRVWPVKGLNGVNGVEEMVATGVIRHIAATAVFSATRTGDSEQPMSGVEVTK